MMKTFVAHDSTYGNLLWISDGSMEAAASLDYGIRIMVLRCAGMENILYRQPDDLSDGISTEKGWRLHGGHRFWAAPESDDSYYPDNDPIEYAIEEDAVLLTQKTDPWTGFQKQFRLSFPGDGSLKVEHILTNRNAFPVQAAAWGITTLKGEGVAEIPYNGDQDGYAPNRSLVFWFDSSPADSRLSYTKNAVNARHLTLEHKLKIGAYTPQGKISMENLGQKLEISFALHPMENHPDHGSNAEIYLDKHIMELETLGEIKEIAPNLSTIHTEYWRIRPTD